MSIKVSFMFYALNEVDKSNDTSSFWRIWTSLYFSFAVFFLFKKGQLKQKSVFYVLIVLSLGIAKTWNWTLRIADAQILSEGNAKM